MAVPIWTYRDMHLVRDSAGYEVLQARAIGRLRARGSQVKLHIDDTPVVARVDDNRWLVDCQCGASNNVDFDQSLARCYDCGAIHTQIVVPDAPTKAAIERELLKRPLTSNRFWFPHETVDDLVAQNRRRRIG